MTEPQKFQLMKSKQDAIIDSLALLMFVSGVYFVINPDKYNRMTDALSKRLGKMEHWLSVFQTKLSIRSLPETDGDE
jgi:hypothetical protein